MVYEDTQVLILNKPVGLVVHADNGGTEDTLIHRVLHHLYQAGTYDPAGEQSFRRLCATDWIGTREGW